MIYLYDLGILTFRFLVWLIAFKNKKAKILLRGRQGLFKQIEKQIDPSVKYIWFHFASLGEFEQGRSIIESLKSTYKEEHVLITFFSPSGYEIRKNYPLADHVFYLPFDTASNAKKWITLIKLKMAIFTKYEYWYHYFNELHKNQIPLYLVAAFFRKSQPFFQFYGGLHRQMLGYVSHFFVQNDASKILLQSIGITQVTVSGDTRFDRVYQNKLHPIHIDAIKSFCGTSPICVAGSTWLDDEKLLALLIEQYPNWKWILVPHEISLGIEKRINKAIKYSTLKTLNTHPVSWYSVLIIDEIGILSSLYQYGHVAYIGGGFGSGIHNTLEPAAFGMPILFGPNYQKFQEAIDMIDLGVAFSVKNITELQFQFEKCQDFNFLKKCSEVSKQYVVNHTGATKKIMTHIFG